MLKNKMPFIFAIVFFFCSFQTAHAIDVKVHLGPNHWTSSVIIDEVADGDENTEHVYWYWYSEDGIKYLWFEFPEPIDVTRFELIVHTSSSAPPSPLYFRDEREDLILLHQYEFGTVFNQEVKNVKKIVLNLNPIEGYNYEIILKEIYVNGSDLPSLEISKNPPDDDEEDDGGTGETPPDGTPGDGNGNGGDPMPTTGGYFDWSFFWGLFEFFLKTAAPFVMIVVAITAVGLLIYAIISAVRAARR